MSKDYTNYIMEHRDNVLKAYQWLVDHNIISNNYQYNIAAHDISKWSNEEYDAYDKYFYGKQGKTTEVNEAFNFAWLHHIHNNPHHWQHWVLINDDDGIQALEMPEEYIIEMFCDHWAFSFKSGNLRELFDWYKIHKTNMIWHRNTKVAYEALLDQVKEALKEEEKKGKA